MYRSSVETVRIPPILQSATSDEPRTESGIPLKPVYGPADAPTQLEPPGEFPYTRGPYPDM
jgi:methylmalonyl-CoA mutase N-terminal domain/subunit